MAVQLRDEEPFEPERGELGKGRIRKGEVRNPWGRGGKAGRPDRRKARSSGDHWTMSAAIVSVLCGIIEVPSKKGRPTKMTRANFLALKLFEALATNEKLLVQTLGFRNGPLTQALVSPASGAGQAGRPPRDSMPALFALPRRTVQSGCRSFSYQTRTGFAGQTRTARRWSPKFSSVPSEISRSLADRGGCRTKVRSECPREMRRV